MEGSVRRLTDEEQLTELERMIELLRPFRDQPTQPEHRSWLALRSAAGDLRARTAVAIGDTRRELEPAMDRLFDSKSALGYETNRMRAVAQIIAARWPTIKQVLTLFEEAVAVAEAIDKAETTGVTTQ